MRTKAKPHVSEIDMTLALCPTQPLPCCHSEVSFCMSFKPGALARTCSALHANVTALSYTWACISMKGKRSPTLLSRYGYAYPCEGGMQSGAVCLLKPTKFRGAPCSDAAGAQKEYSELMQRARQSGQVPEFYIVHALGERAESQHWCRLL